MARLQISAGFSLPLDVASERFHANAGRGDGCWLWRGYVYPSGYGGTEIQGRPVYAHRLSWALHFGPIPEGMQVLHECDTPRCVRPGYLFLGSQQDNIADMLQKGRGVAPPVMRGEKNPKATFSDGDVCRLRSLAKDGRLTQRQLAARFGVSQSTVWRILREATRRVA